MSRYRMDTEAGQQEALFDWMRIRSGRLPELDLAFHIPNGGKRNASEAAHLKRQGVKAGVPDIFLPVARGGSHGLFIEMKYGKNKTTQNQKEWLRALEEQGYQTEVCYGWEQAAAALEEYLEGKE